MPIIGPLSHSGSLGACAVAAGEPERLGVGDSDMPTHIPTQARRQRVRLFAFRAFGAVLLALSIFAIAAAGAGVYYTIKESSVSGWLPPFLVGGIGVAAGIMAVVGVRALRVTSIEELEAESKSEWLEP